MEIYNSKCGTLAGTDYVELSKAARKEYKKIQARNPRRQPYVRSAYFKRDKIFMGQFWEHLKQKRSSDQQRRLRFYACAVDLLLNSRLEPDTKQNPDRKGQLVHRFAGITKHDELFFVQVRESRRTNRKDFMSVFPVESFTNRKDLPLGSL